VNDLKKYECIKSFSTFKANDDGSMFDEDGNEENVSINEGTKWTDYEQDYRFIGGEVRLEQEDGTWLELPKETIAENFKEIF
jgi:hypothetical protein